MQGFIDRRTEALRALDALLDRLEEEEADVDFDAEDSGVVDQADRSRRGETTSPSGAVIARGERVEDHDDAASPAAVYWWRRRSTHHGHAHTTTVTTGGSVLASAPLSVLDLLRDVGRARTLSGSCSHGGDPLADLPTLQHPPGYVRGADGLWRYEFGGLVPGARDDNLASRYRFHVRPGERVLIPTVLASHPVLLWVRDHDDGDLGASTRWLGQHVPAYAVPRSCWNERSRIALGIIAPELMPSAMLDLAAVARLLGVQDSTVTSYRARGRLPSPQYVVANTPLWSWPVIDHWVRYRGVWDRKDRVGGSARQRS